MGTFHSYVSEPTTKKEEAEQLQKEIINILATSKYDNAKRECAIIQSGNFYVVVGVIKNLGGPCIELDWLNNLLSLTCISDEGDVTTIPSHK